MVPPVRRSPLALGFEWASRITTVALGFVLPTVGGAWLDERLGSRPWGVLIGTALGVTAGLVQLVRLARASTRPPTTRPPAHEPPERGPAP